MRRAARGIGRRRLAACCLLAILGLSCRGAPQEPRPENMGLLNGSFEEPAVAEGREEGDAPACWFFFAPRPASRVAVTTRARCDGRQGAVFKMADEALAMAGLGQRFRAVAGREYAFTVQVRNDREEGLRPRAGGYLAIEWYDARGKGLRRDRGRRWDFETSALRWEQAEVRAVSPPGADVGVATIVCESPAAGGLSSCHVDQAVLTRSFPGTTSMQE